MARILVVSAADVARRGMRRTLETAGYDVAEAMSAAEARTRLQREACELVVTDVVPEMGGLDLVRELRDVGSPARILAVSAGSRSTSAALALVMGLALGADAVLYTPFSDEELLQSVARLLAG